MQQRRVKSKERKKAKRREKENTKEREQGNTRREKWKKDSVFIAGLVSLFVFTSLPLFLCRFFSNSKIDTERTSEKGIHLGELQPGRWGQNRAASKFPK